MSHKNKVPLVDQVVVKFDKMFCPGRSRYDDKKNDDTKNRIYSYETRRAYKKQSISFVNFVKKQPVKPELGHKPRTIDECRLYVEDYLCYRESCGLSPFTVRLDAAALAKLFNCSIGDFDIELSARTRSKIVRSRGVKARDRHFSEKRNADFVNFCKATGLRRSEIQKLRGMDLIRDDEGNWRISIRGKGGKHRNALIFSKDPEVVEMVVRKMQDADTGKVWPHVPNGADIHSYRAFYATALYKHLARDPKTIPREERYDCRKDLKGTHYDRKAMKIVSQNLGHERVCVIASNYLRI